MNKNSLPKRQKHLYRRLRKRVPVALGLILLGFQINGHTEAIESEADRDIVEASVQACRKETIGSPCSVHKLPGRCDRLEHAKVKVCIPNPLLDHLQRAR